MRLDISHENNNYNAWVSALKNTNEWQVV